MQFLEEHCNRDDFNNINLLEVGMLDLGRRVRRCDHSPRFSSGYFSWEFEKEVAPVLFNPEFYLTVWANQGSQNSKIFQLNFSATKHLKVQYLWDFKIVNTNLELGIPLKISVRNVLMPNISAASFTLRHT